MVDYIDEACIDNNLLISLLKQQPVLWDRSMELYKNRVATREAWHEVMTALNPDFEKMKDKTREAYTKLIISKWTHIRDNYNRSLKKIEFQKSTGTTLSKITKPYVYSKQLSFLDKVLLPNKMLITGDMSKESDSPDEASDTESDSTDADDTVSNDPLSMDHKLKRPIKNEQPEEAKKPRITNLFSYSQESETNRHLAFFHGILPTLTHFDDNEVLEFQMGVLQLLKDIKNSRKSNNNSSRFRQPTQ